MTARCLERCSGGTFSSRFAPRESERGRKREMGKRFTGKEKLQRFSQLERRIYFIARSTAKNPGQTKKRREREREYASRRIGYDSSYDSVYVCLRARLRESRCSRRTRFALQLGVLKIAGPARATSPAWLRHF